MIARRVMDGKVGDQYAISNDYEERWKNVVGIPIPQRGSKGKPQPILGCKSLPPKLCIVERPDFRSVDKNDHVMTRHMAN
ncbi:unnamed protein product, partial [Mesorhabditis belari]|uniref:Uncharacterized protein n=1 Tax=Mesorhabditis belari TaxID=2138241 RepID=A0AAF3FKB2_9BILA